MKALPKILQVSLLLAVSFGFAPLQAATNAKPNIIFILVDDMGWTDVGCFGGKLYETPNIYALAKQGMKFTQAYSACTVCSPTRSAVMTGKYPARTHITDWIPGHVRPFAKLSVPDWTMYLSLQEMNIAKRLKTSGYATASIGKWHLGPEEYYPDKQGFDINLGGTDRGQPPSYFSPYKIATLPDGPPGEFLSDRLTTEATKFIEKNKDHPFFLYLPHFAVHTPLMGKPEVIAKYKAKIQPDWKQHNATYAALVESVDDSIGTIMKKLEELKIADNTVIIFNSDNGGLTLGQTTDNTPLRAGKGSSYEGGVRVPLIIKWPGVTKADSVCETPVITPDYYPTLLEITGISDDSAHQPDGVSLVPLLKQTGQLPRDTIYWHYPHYHPGGATPYSAMKQGDMKLIEFFEDKHIEIYDLKSDIGEQHDLVSEMPEKARELQAKLASWRTEVGAQLPTVNPNFDPSKNEVKKSQALKKGE